VAKSLPLILPLLSGHASSQGEFLMAMNPIINLSKGEKAICRLHSLQHALVLLFGVGKNSLTLPILCKTSNPNPNEHSQHDADSNKLCTIMMKKQFKKINKETQLSLRNLQFA
jgi:hypothetical protein